MSDINEEQKRLYKRAEENDKENLKYMSTEEALNQIKQRIMMHKLDNTTSNENEREKVILNYINELQDRINKAYKILDKIQFFTTPIGQVVHLDMIISDIRKVKSILKGKE